jgi:hypothetical protein
MADGKVLSPVVNCIQEKNNAQFKFRAEEFSHIHERGWMNEEGLKLRLDNVCNRQVHGLQKLQPVCMAYVHAT